MQNLIQPAPTVPVKFSQPGKILPSGEILPDWQDFAKRQIIAARHYHAAQQVFRRPAGFPPPGRFSAALAENCICSELFFYPH